MKRRDLLTVAPLLGGAALTFAQTAAPPPEAQQRKPRPGGPKPPAPDDAAGFTPIFDGKSLEGWDGDPNFWRAEGGSIVGETTPEKVLKPNTFIIWRGGTTANFELKLDYRISESGNSGVQYRSAALPDQGKWVLKGYQCDIDGLNRYTGMLYEERGRGFLAERGRVVRMPAEGGRKLIGSPGEGDALKEAIKVGDWNQIHIIARGEVIVHLINNRVMSLFIDEDPKGRASEGLLGLQLHMGPPMKVEFRNILLKRL